MTLTPKQLEVAAYVWNHARDKGSAPSLREVGRALGVSVTTVWEHAQHLRGLGVLVAAGDRRRRGLEVAHAAAETLGLVAHRHARIRARAAAVARGRRCSAGRRPGHACPCPRCRVAEEIARDLERAALAEVL